MSLKFLIAFALSGTTGVPKGVMSTHRNYGAMMNIYREYVITPFYSILIAEFMSLLIRNLSKE